MAKKKRKYTKKASQKNIKKLAFGGNLTEQQNSMIGLGAGMTGDLAQSALPNNPVLGNTLGGAAKGVATGAALGVPGMLVGGAIGGIGGAINGSKQKKLEEQQSQLQMASDARSANYMGNPANGFLEQGGELTRYNGLTHNQGGIQLGTNEVENQETSFNNYVFSDKLLNPITGNTFAEDSKKINDRFNLRSKNDKYSSEKIHLTELRNSQETVKQQALSRDLQKLQKKYPDNKFWNGGQLSFENQFKNIIPDDDPKVVTTRNTNVKSLLTADQMDPSKVLGKAYLNAYSNADDVNDMKFYENKSLKSIDGVNGEFSLDDINASLKDFGAPKATAFSEGRTNMEFSGNYGGNYKLNNLPVMLQPPGAIEAFFDYVYKKNPDFLPLAGNDRLFGVEHEKFIREHPEVIKEFFNPETPPESIVPTDPTDPTIPVDPTDPPSIVPGVPKTNPPGQLYTPPQVEEPNYKGQNLGNIAGIGMGLFNMFQKPTELDKVNVTETGADFKLLDPTRAIQDVRTSYAGANDVIKNNARSSGNYLSNRLASAAQQAKGTSTVNSQYDNANVGIENQFNQFNANLNATKGLQADMFNAQQGNLEKQINEQRLDGGLNAITKGLTGISENKYRAKQDASLAKYQEGLLNISGGANSFVVNNGGTYNKAWRSDDGQVSMIVKDANGNPSQVVQDEDGNWRYSDPNTKPAVYTEQPNKWDNIKQKLDNGLNSLKDKWNSMEDYTPIDHNSIENQTLNEKTNTAISNIKEKVNKSVTNSTNIINNQEALRNTEYNIDSELPEVGSNLINDLHNNTTAKGNTSKIVTVKGYQYRKVGNTIQYYNAHNKTWDDVDNTDGTYDVLNFD